MGSIRRLLIVAPLLPWLAVSAIWREHVHESHAPDHESVAHTHFAPHLQRDHELAAHDHDGAEFSEPDEDVVWMDQVGLVAAIRSFPPPLVILSTHIEIVPERLVGVAILPDEATLPHGPPRVPPSLRGPPLASL